MNIDKNYYKFFDKLFNDMYLPVAYNNDNNKITKENLIKSTEIFSLIIIIIPVLIFLGYCTISDNTDSIVNMNTTMGSIISMISIYAGYVIAEILIDNINAEICHLSHSFLALSTALICFGTGTISFYDNVLFLYPYIIINLFFTYYIVHKNMINNKMPLLAIPVIAATSYLVILFNNVHIGPEWKLIIIFISILGFYLNYLCTNYIVNNHIAKMLTEEKYSYLCVWQLLAIFLLMPIYCWHNYMYYFLNTFDDEKRI